ncbi:trace amine-associated receptor 5-like [Oculina patagonica]
MCSRTSIPWIVIFGVESLVITLGNIITIIVFSKNRSQLKRTCYLLINLSVADLMVGVGTIEEMLTYSSCSTSWADYIALNEFFGCASISFLALISLERLYAIVWPFRIWATSTRNYICSIGVAWIFSGIFAAVRVILNATASSTSISKSFFTWFPPMYMLVCLITISCAYSVIWFCSKKEDPRLPLDRQKRNKELAKTLFIVTLLSVITWLPFTVAYTLRYTSKGYIFNVARFLQLANSFINPIVYCLRMPLFRTTLRTMFAKKRTTALQVHIREHPACSENNAAVLLSISTLNVATNTYNTKHNLSHPVISSF